MIRVGDALGQATMAGFQMSTEANSAAGQP